MNPENVPTKSQPEEHKMNALAKEFQITLSISTPFGTMPYTNYYPNYNEYQYRYPPPPFGYHPMVPYKFGGMPQQPFAENFYPNEKSFVRKH